MENSKWKTPATKQGEEFEMIAKTFQGLETVLATELIDLGANNIQIGRRMVSFTGNKELLYRANFQLRTAIRILMPIKHFRATSADEVYEAVQQIDWTDYLTNETTFAVDSVVFSNEFRHSKFVAYKVKDAIVDQMRERTGGRPNIQVTNPDLQLHIHIAEYDCTLSLDTSGESLHRRGYRQETVEAPLNEVLAAGIIMLTGWKGECDLIDPMCGSGTIPIEAALIARGIAPGVYRKEYAFEKWPDFDQELFDSIYEDDSREHDFEHHIYGYDINRNAVAIATTNVKAAGLSKEISIQQQDFADFKQPKEKSVIITNPPYGERISAPDLLGLYKMIGKKFKHDFTGNDAWVLSYREECFDQIGLKPSLRTPLYNGSLECELRKYQMFSGKFNEMRASGGDIKTAQERRMMADRKRFKQHRDFKERLEDDPRERFTRKKDREDYRRDNKRGDYRKPYEKNKKRPPSDSPLKGEKRARKSPFKGDLEGFKIINILILFIMLTTTGSLFAQKLFTLEELNFGGKNALKFSPERWQLRWDGDKLIDAADKKAAIVIDRKTGKTIEGETVNLDANKRSKLDGELEYCKESGAVAFLKDSNLWVASADGAEHQLSSDGSRNIVYGQSVHRDEFGIHKGTFWSPDGQQLAFYRMDQSMVADYPQVNTFEREATLAPDKYPMAGMTSHKVTVGIFSLQTGKTIYLDFGDTTDRYFTNIAWAPDGKTLYLYELNRDQNHTTLDAYDATTGKKLRTLREESSDKYVEPLHPITFLPWDSSKFIYWSWKDGYKHLYLMDTEGRELGQLTSGKWVVKELVGFCPATKSAIIITKEAGDLQRNIYSLNLKTKKRTLLDNGRGCHSAQLSADGRYLIDTWQEPNVPRACAVTDTKTGKQSLLRTASDPWEGWYQPVFEQGTILAADGETTLYWRMVKPMDFDPSKKYPTVIYVYGGPHAHCVEASWHWGSRSWETYMAQKGYILFILDNRGSEDRGRDFEQVTFRHLGQEEMKDQMQGVAFLKTLPYVDADRLGVHGWSYGGFMTTSLMTTYPDVFKVGVAGGPVIDWKWYEVMYGERYMDTPQQNPEGYEQTSCINKAKNLKGKLQIIIGMNDPTCVPQHSLQFLNACSEAGTQPDFFVYPGEGHNMAGHKSVHLHERITQYFEDYLKNK